MGFFIHREREHDRIITMGQAGRVIEPPQIETPPPAIIESKPRRTRKMPDEKKLGHETGVKKISQEPADKQGPIGTGAQDQPRREPGEEVKIGGDKESEGGKEE